jgi:23S rRNA (adenine2030-N6)-methyltransferase
MVRAMNYRHAYHAGNFADVMKHAALALMVEYLKRKDTPFFVLDTHAGIGLYDLASEQAGKTGEWRSGILPVLEAAHAPAEATPYLDLVKGLNEGSILQTYPGSPTVAARLMRDQDRLALVELHPEDVRALKARFAGDRRVGVHHMDGYQALKALLPPTEKRGLVLMDPPFEVADEFERLRKGLALALKRWPNGMFGLWYPIKAREKVARWHADLEMLGLPKTLVAELMIRAGDAPDTLNGNGLVLVNPPWKLDEALAALLPWLAAAMAPDEGSTRVEWLVPER